jgi:hypothetical protein
METLLLPGHKTEHFPTFSHLYNLHSKGQTGIAWEPSESVISSIPVNNFNVYNNPSISVVVYALLQRINLIT